jgi:coproporphyrinogen III oxidase-like Fe-S oxidoreductase
MILTSLLRIALTRSIKPFVFKDTYENRLDFDTLDNLGLYVHIPFCKRICSFCPYCKEIYNESLALSYKQALLKEIDLVCKDMKQKKLVSSLYFGGGTPALLINDLAEIIEGLKKYFDIRDGIGIELHPEDITDEILFRLKCSGVSMISIGIQSFNERCLSKIGRKHRGQEDRLALIQKYHFAVVDMDLIFGIPGQNKEILKHDIETAFKYGATQVSTYPFIDFTFANNQYKPLSHSVKREMLKGLKDICSDLGAQRTSVWTFAKKDTKAYSSVTRDAFLGFGVSATTLLKDVFKINTFSIHDYINRINHNDLPTSLTLEFTKRQRAAYYLFWSAYGLQVNEEAFEKLMGIPLRKMYGIELFMAELLGMLSKHGPTYYLTDKASYLYHYLEQQYTTAYIDKMWNISRKISFPKKIILK